MRACPRFHPLCLRLATFALIAGATALPAAPHALSWAPSVATAFAWHDNATNAERAADVLPAAQLTAELSGFHRFILGRDDTLLILGRVFTESWPQFDGLDRASPGLRGTYQHKFALGAFAPTLRLVAAGDLVLARESGRAGRSGSVALSYRQRLHPDWLVQLSHERARYDARALAFDRTGRETTALVAWQTATPWHLELALRDRFGTVLSYSSPPRPDLVASGKRLVFVDTFARDVPLIAYYFPARTRSVELRASRTLGREYTVAFTGAWRKTTHGIDSFYLNRIFSASLAREF